MKKSLSVVIAAVALVITPGIAHADAIDNAINNQFWNPDLHSYLQTARTIGVINDTADVQAVGMHYFGSPCSSVNSLTTTQVRNSVKFWGAYFRGGTNATTGQAQQLINAQTALCL